MITVINANAAVTPLQQRPEKNFQALSGIRTHDLSLRCRCSALPTELSKPHESGRMRASPLHVDVMLGPSIVKNESKGLTRIRPLSCGFDSSVGRAMNLIAEVVGSNPAQSLKILFRSLFQ